MKKDPMSVDQGLNDGNLKEEGSYKRGLREQTVKKELLKEKGFWNSIPDSFPMLEEVIWID